MKRKHRILKRMKSLLGHRKRIIAVLTVVLVTVGFCMLLRVWTGEQRNKKQSALLTVGECMYSINTLLEEELFSEEETAIGQKWENEAKTATSDLYEDEKNIKKDSAMSGEVFEAMIGQIGLEHTKKEVLLKKYAGCGTIGRKAWMDILKQIADSLGMKDTIQEKQISIFEIMEGEAICPIITDEKGYTYYGGNTGLTRDMVVTVLKRGDKIIFAGEGSRDKVIFENVLLKKTSEGKLTVSVNGCDREFLMPEFDQVLENVTADIVLGKKTSEIIQIRLKRESVSGKLLAVTDEGVELEGYGLIRFSSKCRFYLAGKPFDQTGREILIVGSGELAFVVADQEICAVIKEQEDRKISSGSIRVLLKNTGYQGLFHEKADLSCSGKYRLTYFTKDEAGNLVENSSEHEASEMIQVESGDFRLKEGRLTVTPLEAEGKTTVNSLLRNGRNPAYRGKIEIAGYEEGLILINELSIEEYLYAVVPSEMPSSYGTEALKVQAVCARSYAVSHLGDTKLSAYGAQINDSTDYQVYNNTEETSVSIEAVNETAGEILLYEGAVANTYFFATSCGSTTNAGIWGSDNLPYIHGRLLCAGEVKRNLTDNEEFRQFIKEDFDSFDKDSPWYRWKLVMTYEQFTEIINKNLKTMALQYPDKILFRQPDGSYLSKPVDSIGKVRNISVEKRLEGGVAEELLIEGEAGSIKVLKQSTIRNLINPNGTPIQKKDGSIVDTFTSLPSAFFAVEQNTEGIMFWGGGFGHGAGMSQTAVKAMVGAGMHYEDILKFFYTGIEIGSYE